MRQPFRHGDDDDRQAAQGREAAGAPQGRAAPGLRGGGRWRQGGPGRPRLMVVFILLLVHTNNTPTNTNNLYKTILQDVMLVQNTML